MAYNLQVVKTSDFVRMDGKGNLDLVESRRALERIAKTCIERGASCALLDVRKVHSDLKYEDLYTLITAFNAMGFRKDHRLAILHRYSGGEKADFFALCASTRGWNVRAFDNYEEAIEWFETEQSVG
jgi:hypothetical protein